MVSKTTISTFLILLVASLCAHAQLPRHVVFWTAEPGCGFRSKAFTQNDQISCTTTPTERGPVSSITVNGIRLDVAFSEKDEFMLVAAQITNNNQDVLSLDTDVWGAAHYKTKPGFYAGDKPILAESSIPSRDLVRGIFTEGKMENAVGEMMADGTMTTESRIMTRPDGTKYRIDVIVPDQDAKQTENRQRATRYKAMTREQREVLDAALIAKSVQPGEKVAGVVYFRRVKDAQFTVFSLGVGDATVVFQLPKMKKQKATS